MIIDSKSKKESNMNEQLTSASEDLESNVSSHKKNINASCPEADNASTLEKKFPVRRPLDKANNRFPFCIVWTPLPVITWILPFFGHTGICT